MQHELLVAMPRHDARDERVVQDRLVRPVVAILGEIGEAHRDVEDDERLERQASAAVEDALPPRSHSSLLPGQRRSRPQTSVGRTRWAHVVIKYGRQK